MAKKRKSTNAEIKLRVGEISQLIIQGKNKREIIDYVSDKWDIGERQANNYIRKSETYISEQVNKDFQRDYSIAVLRYTEIFKLAKESSDLRLCKDVIKLLAELQELSKQQVEHSGNIQFINNLPLE